MEYYNKHSLSSRDVQAVSRLKRAAFVTIKTKKVFLVDWKKAMRNEHNLILIEVYGKDHNAEELDSALNYLWMQPYTDTKTGYTLTFREWAYFFMCSTSYEMYEKLCDAKSLVQQIAELDSMGMNKPSKDDIRYRKIKTILAVSTIVVVAFLGIMNLVSHRYHYYSHSGLTTVYDRWTGEKEVINMFEIYRNSKNNE